jgi:L-ascorbate metabolism protein UlaG (beta-lactamase superfamily)
MPRIPLVVRTARRCTPARSLVAVLLAAAAVAACVNAPGPSVALRPARPAMTGGTVEVLWLGQSAFRIRTPGGKVIVTDPWLVRNPVTPPEYKDLKNLGKVDVLLVTHGHLDHVADAPALARLNEIPMIGPGGLNQTLTTLGVLPGTQLPRFNKSGTVTPVPNVSVTAVRAEHSSEFVWRNPATDRDETHFGGEPIGYIITLENGFRIWHMGDTGLFGDMKLIAERYRPDLVLVPIGGNFTMDPVDAAYAVGEIIRPKFVIPMHYGANPLGRGNPKEFSDALGAAPVKVLPLKPGERATF